MYKVVWESSVEKDLKKFDKAIVKKIKERVENHLAQDPTEFGKPLKGKLEGLWKYRCFDKYRIVYQILKDKLIITVVEAGLRKDIYRKLSRKKLS